MKRIIALMLIVCCILSFAACKRNTDDPTPTPTPTPDNTPDTPTQDVVEDKLTDEEIAAIAALQAKVDASVPETAKITVLLESALDDLHAEYNVAYNLDGTGAVVEGWYEKFNEISGDVFADDYKTVRPVSALVNVDGTVTGDVAFVEAVTFEINLDAAKLTKVDVKSNALSATVKAADTLAVLGVAIDADVQIFVSVGTLGVSSVAIAYASSAGDVEISATYTYYVPSEEDGEEVAE